MWITPRGEVKIPAIDNAHLHSSEVEKVPNNGLLQWSDMLVQQRRLRLFSNETEMIPDLINRQNSKIA